MPTFNPKAPFTVVEGGGGLLFNSQGGVLYDYAPPYRPVLSNPNGLPVLGGGIGQVGRTSGVTYSGLATDNVYSGVFKGNTNWAQTETIPCGIDSVQIAFLSNVADASTWTGIRAYLQTTDLSGGGADGQNPYLKGVLQTMNAATWNGGDSPTFTNATAQLPIPTEYSDPIPVNNTGPGISYLIARSYWPSGVATGGSYVDVNGTGGLFGTRVASLASIGAFASYRTNVGANTSANNNVNFTVSTAALPYRFKLNSRVPVIAYWYFGDSVGQGYKVFGLVSAVERFALKQSIAGIPTAVSNRSMQGQTTTQFLARLRQAVAAGERCDRLVWQCASPNDGIANGYNQTTLNQMVANTHEAIQLAEKMGAHIHLLGPHPVTAVAPTAGQTLVVGGMRDFVAAMEKSGRNNISVSYFDELHLKGAYGQWVAVYNEGNDYLHPSERAAQEVIIPNLTTALRKIG